MSGSRIVDLTIRGDYNARMLARLLAHQGFHSVQASYGLTNVLRLRYGSVPFDVLSEMLVVFRQTSGEWIAKIDEIKLVKGDGGACDLVLAPFVRFTQTGVQTPVDRYGVSMLYVSRHRFLDFRARDKEGDIGYFRPQLLPSSR